MKNIPVLIVSLFLCLFFVGCSSQKENKVEEDPSIFRETFTEVESLDKVEGVAGFPIKIPEEIFKDDYRSEIRAIKGKVIQVTYYGMEKLVIIRKAISNGEEDISRDFNDYPDQYSENVDGKKVILRGSDEKINVMSWSSGNYNYSINLNPGGIGFDKGQVYRIMKQVE